MLERTWYERYHKSPLLLLCIIIIEIIILPQIRIVKYMYINILCNFSVLQVFLLIFLLFFDAYYKLLFVNDFLLQKVSH